MLAGTVCGGWMMAEATRVALAAGDGDPFHAAKLATARFYCAQVLPRAAACRAAVVDGSAAVAELDTALL
jgi:hypothetical protein